MMLPLPNFKGISTMIIYVTILLSSMVFSIDSKFSQKTTYTEHIDAEVINSKIDKVYSLTSQFQDQFKWEQSILSEIAQTQSYVLSEIRGQEHRIRRLNRNLKRTLKFCANQNLLSAREVTTHRPYKVFSNKM